jgi:peptide/nickel transport system permease protein
MRYSPAAGIGRIFSGFIGMGKRYGLEWWILIVGALIIAAILSMAVFADNLAPFDPLYQNAGPQLAPPGGKHLLGTDNLQRDVWSRIIHGSRTILRVSVLAAIIS